MEVKKLEIASFFGFPSTPREVALTHRGLLVYGPNGVGKSSVVSGIEAVLKGQPILHAETRQRAAVESALPHIRGGTPKISLKMREAGNDYTATWTGEGVTADEGAKAWMELAKSSNFVLRRFMLLQFVECRPADRYEILRPFLDLSEYEDFEGQIRQIESVVESAVSKAQTEIGIIDQGLREVFAIPLSGGIEVTPLRATIDSDLRALGLESVSDWNALPAKLQEVDVQIAGGKPDPRTVALQALVSMLQDLPLGSSWSELYTAAESAAASYERLVAGKTDEWLASWLGEGHRHLAAVPTDICYFCEGQIERTKLLARLAARIAADKQLISARGARDTAIKTFRNALLPHLPKYTLFCEQWNELLGGSAPPEYVRMRDWLAEATTVLEGPDHGATKIASLKVNSTELVTGHDTAKTTIEMQLPQSGPGERFVKLQSLRKKLEDYRDKIPKRILRVQRAQENLHKQEQLKILLAHIAESRKETITAILGKVDSRANNYYTQMHPDEGIGASKTSVRANVQGSVQLDANFHGTQESPLLHYSESHLDTLGLAYFLAIRRLEADDNSGFKILVLDDVMHSVDAEHRGRVAVLLANEFADHQIVVTTHDEILFNRIAAAVVGISKLKILGWDIDGGPSVVPSQTDWDTVLDAGSRTNLSTGDIGTRTGRVFEDVLKHVCERIKIAVPLRLDGRYTAADLWQPAASKLRRQATFLTTHPKLLDELEASGWVRNATAHDQSQFPIPTQPNEANDFADMVSRLAVAVRCSKCNRYIERRDTGDWTCSCATLKYLH